jgi:pimeloyl-ACP methyl ester carboxylesterase
MELASPVLLIHGTAPAAWGALPDRLAARHRVVEYDRRGFMASQAAPEKDLSRHAEDARELISGLGLGPAVVVGWSIGGVIALEVAMRWPELVAGLVLLEPPFRVKRHPTVRMLRAILGAKARALVRRPEAGGERFLAWALSRRDGSDDIDRIAPGYRDKVRLCGLAIVRELDGGTGEHLDMGALSAIDVPVVVLRGSDSTPELGAAAERVASLLPTAARVDVPGSGHALAVDAPEAVVDAVARVAQADAPTRAF